MGRHGVAIQEKSNKITACLNGLAGNYQGIVIFVSKLSVYSPVNFFLSWV